MPIGRYCRKRRNADGANTNEAFSAPRRGNELSTAIVWFRRDLRLEDNPALDAALRAHDRIVCAYVHAPDEEAWAPGAAGRWWLHHALESLDATLHQRGARLHIVRGPAQEGLERLQTAAAAAAIYWNRLYEPARTQRDAAIKASLRARGIDAHGFNASLLIEPWDVATAQGTPYKVFTPFWRSARARFEPRPPIPAPRAIPSATVPGALSIDALQLLPRIDWAGGLRNAWNPGEAGARDLLDRFIDDALAVYETGRDVPAADHTSRLSPHLHFGEIGPRQIVWRLAQLTQAPQSLRTGVGAFERELGWREFSHHLLYHFPKTPQRNFNRTFDAFPWARADRRTLKRWQRGTTGIPIIDAGMRQLWNCGWMHNRVRMLVASFLTKNLRLHWRHGARWFWDTLVDADLANNTLGWQWVAGSGADAAPYFRIFNPVTQGQRFDPAGDYVRRWVPELRGVPPHLIHEPWREAGLPARCGYPEPMVDLRGSREAALAAYRVLRLGG